MSTRYVKTSARRSTVHVASDRKHRTTVCGQRWAEFTYGEEDYSPVCRRCVPTTAEVS